MLYGYYGGAYFQRNFGYLAATPTSSCDGVSGFTCVGFGFPGSANTSNRAIQEGTIGVPLLDPQGAASRRRDAEAKGMQLRMSPTAPPKTCLAKERTMTDIVRDELRASKIVDRSTFHVELDALRVREKAHTREGDAIAAARRRLPMVEVDPTITLIGPHGSVTLLDAFESRRQLIAYYFMWHTGHPAPEQCEGCTGLHRRSASCPTFILATSPSPCFAKARTKRAPGTATSWDGRCLGTRPRTRSTPSWLVAGWAGCTSFATCDKEPKSSRRTGRRHAASRRWITVTDCST
jgi:hypothetical protein